MYRSLHLLHFNQQPVNPVFVFFLFCFLPQNQNKSSSAMWFADQSERRAPPAGWKVHSRPPLTTTRSPRIGHCIPVCLTHAVSTSSEVAVWLTCSQVKGRGNLPLLLLLFLLQKCATTFISRPEAAPEPWAWFDAWPTSMWWSPELKLAHSRLAESQGDRETSGPAPSTDSVAKHAADQRVTGGSAA